MIRQALPATLLLACAICPAAAQEQAAGQTIPVYFQQLPGGEFTPLNKAILAALSEPPLQLAEKPSAGVVTVALDGKVEVTHKKISGNYYDFTVTFTRNGSSLGQSAQSCSDKKLSDCTDQLVLDVKSVAGVK